jgi:hypothetical protein
MLSAGKVDPPGPAGISSSPAVRPSPGAIVCARRLDTLERHQIIERERCPSGRG